MSISAPRFPFTSNPTGWFRVAFSSEIPPSGVKPLHFFGKDLVLFRTKGGTPYVLDAHCPHLGAHLGYGVVCGETVQCPFHGWQINGEGACVGSPYFKEAPEHKKIYSWPVREINETILVFYHPKHEMPSWEVTPYAALPSKKWTPYKHVLTWKIRTHLQDLGENGVDVVHSWVLHNQCFSKLHSRELKFEGHILHHYVSAHFNAFSLMRRFAPAIKGDLHISSYGLGCHIVRSVVNIKNITLKQNNVFFTTPIDDEYLELASIFTMEKLSVPFVTSFLARKAMQETRQFMRQDNAIWQRKLYRDNPPLATEIEKNTILPFRNWAKQFYEET